MAFTWIPCGASSTARALVRPISPALEAAYAARFGATGRIASTEAMLMMAPPVPWATIRFAAAVDANVAAFRFRDITQSKNSGDISNVGTMG